MQAPNTRSPWVCQRCLKALRSRSSSTIGVRAHKRFRSDNAATQRQAIPLSGYYAELLSHPSSRSAPLTRTVPAAAPLVQPSKTTQEETLERARQVFGSRLSGAAERAEELRNASVNIGGILVPPKPDEPDNCCMSGCVNCVWDLYRDELEEWASKNAEARQMVLSQRQKGQATGSMTAQEGMPQHVATSMDDDGGGSETNWDVGLKTSSQDDDLFQNIPVGIREFMKTEKLLKQKIGSNKGGKDRISNILPSESGRGIQWVH